MSLRITLDVFSGRPNPSWVLTDETLVRRIVSECASALEALTPPGRGYTGLGYRGVQVDVLDPIEAPGLPPSFEVGGGGASNTIRSAAVAGLILETMPTSPPYTDAVRLAGPGGDFPFNEEFRRWALEEAKESPFGSHLGSLHNSVREEAANPATQVEPSADVPLVTEQEVKTAPLTLRADRPLAAQCPWDADPGYFSWWNQSDIQPFNNCYNFACARRTDTFAQPGRSAGYTIPSTLTCAQVAFGATWDGNQVWGNCFPSVVLRQYIMALVTGTFPGGNRDYHWYRYLNDGTWGHKPGTADARNTDNTGAAIHDPYYAARAPYDEWCGWFQTAATVNIL